MDLSNHLLCELPKAVRREVAQRGQRVRLSLGEILQLQGEPQTHCHFVEAGIVSLSRLQADGSRLETGLVGREGFVGSSAGDCAAFTEAKVEIAGAAIRLETSALQGLLRRESTLRDVLGRYQRFQLEEAQLNAVCNASHAVQARLAKWLLRCLDRADEAKLALTQESLAEMLGVQRTTVTASIQRLAAEGIIRSGRGLIEVMDRERLMAISCDCYERAAERLPELGFPEPGDESACAA